MRTKLIYSIILAVLSSSLSAKVVDTYKFSAKLKIPIIVNNMTSQGRRVPRYQNLVGKLKIIYKDGEFPSIEIDDLYNKSYKINDKYVTYDSTVSSELVNYIGDNKFNRFITPTMRFDLDANPSYNIGEDEPDNTLLITLSGFGSSRIYKNYNKARIIKYISGKVSGQIGCGCSEYGHVSPTRVAGPNGPTDIVVDTAALLGTWNIKFLNRKISGQLP